MPAGRGIDCRSGAGSGCQRQLAATLLAEAESNRSPIAIQRTAPVMTTESPEGFVSMSMPANPAEAPIRVEVRQKRRSVSIEWPASAARECAHLLKELIR